MPPLPASKLTVHRLVLAAALAAAFAAAGCAKPPDQEVGAAEASLAQAKAVGADVYAAPAYHKAEESMAQAKAEVDAQKGKFRLLQRYGQAKTLLAKAQKEAEEAKNGANEGRAMFQQDAQIALDAARTRLEAAATAVAGAPAGKDSKADIEAMKGDLEALRATLAEADASYTGQDYATAKQKAEQVGREAATIEADVARAHEKVNRS